MAFALRAVRPVVARAAASSTSANHAVRPGLTTARRMGRLAFGHRASVRRAAGVPGCKGNSMFRLATPMPHHRTASSSSSSSSAAAEASVLATSKAYRSHYCGRVGTCDGAGAGAVGERVTVSGWVHSYRHLGKHGIAFAVIRDWTGTVQVTWESADSEAIGLRPSSAVTANLGDGDGEGALLGLETVVSVSGVVRARPDDMVNPDMRTGAVEIVAESVRVLNTAAEVPVEIKAATAAAKQGRGQQQQHQQQGQVQSEDFLLRNRHLQLRMPHMQRNLRVRSAVTNAVRTHLSARDFVEVETPLLFKSTPEGAREFIVPTRTADHFYALPQSPQQFKQLLMVGGLDRYFQVARCFRDESGRADRQPEFTQIDIEMSFVDREGIMNTAEDLAINVFRTVAEQLPTWRRDTDVSAFALPDLSRPVPRMSFREAMGTYGVDKPDTRFGLRLHDVTEALLPGHGSNGGGGGGSGGGDDDSPNCDLRVPTVQALRIPALSGMLSRKQFDELAASWEALTTGVFANEPPPAAAQQQQEGGEGGEAAAVSSSSSSKAAGGNLARAARGPPGADFLRNLAFVRVKGAGSEGGVQWQAALAKHVGEDARAAVSAAVGAADGDLVVLAAGHGWEPHAALGRLRLAAREVLAAGAFGPPLLDLDAAEAGLPQPAEKPAARSDLLWVVDFPLFEPADDENGGSGGAGAYASSHHPFTAPAPEHLSRLLRAAETVGTPADTGEVLTVGAQHYDLVLNGCEIAGGSVRIHDPAVQQLVFDRVLQIPADRQETFRHLLAALRQGAPPHAGIAFGLDRLMAMLLGADSIREVIAFPKSATGRDLMTGAPATVTDAQLEYYHQMRRK